MKLNFVLRILEVTKCQKIFAICQQDEVTKNFTANMRLQKDKHDPPQQAPMSEKTVER